MSETKIIQHFTIKSADRITFLNEFAEAIKMGAYLRQGAYFFTSLPMRVDMEIELSSVEDALIDTPYRVVNMPITKEGNLFSLRVEDKEEQKSEDLTIEEFEKLDWTEMRSKAKELNFESTKKEAIIDEYRAYLENKNKGD